MISVLISLLLTLRGLARSRAGSTFEVLALRHQLQVLERSRRRRVRLVKMDVGYTLQADRFFSRGYISASNLQT
jgi:hypothetical protein